MATYTFTGKVMPERANVNISVLSLTFQAKDAGFSGETIISIACSQVSIKLDTPDTGVDLPTMKNYLGQIVRNLVDSYGYISGRGYDIEITSVVDPNGQQTVFGVGIRELEESEDERPLSFRELFQVMLKSPHLRHALGDLREAIRSPSDTGFYCYRAVECLRQHFREAKDSNKNQSWKRLRQNLRIDRSWIKPLENCSKEQRHGSSPYMSGENRIRLMKHAWKVIDRFCVYINRNSQPLSDSEFDVLK